MDIKFTIFVVLEKNATIKLDFKNKINMNKIPNKISCEGFEPQFYEELCPITTLESSTPTTPHTKPPNPTYNTKPLALIII